MNKETILKYTPDLLTTAGVTGYLSAVVMGIMATPKAMEKLEQHDMVYVNRREEIIEKGKLLFPVYAPTIATCLIATGMVYGSLHVSKKRYTSLLGLYTFSQTYLHKLQQNVLDSVGQKEYDTIMANTAAPKDPPPTTMIIQGDRIPVYDDYSKRYFTVDSVEYIRGAMNTTNEIMFDSGFASLNDFYFELGLEQIDIGNMIGWSSKNGAIRVRIDSMMMQDSRPCILLTFNMEPKIGG